MKTEPVTEKEFDAQVRELCDIYGWRRYHTYQCYVTLPRGSQTSCW